MHEEAHDLFPQAVLDKRGNPRNEELLAHWHGCSPATATWDKLDL
jgi:hypothetical protein